MYEGTDAGRAPLFPVRPELRAVPDVPHQLSLIHIFRKPEVGLFEPVLRVTKEEMDAYDARTGKTLVRVAGAVSYTHRFSDSSTTSTSPTPTVALLDEPADSLSLIHI